MLSEEPEMRVKSLSALLLSATLIVAVCGTTDGWACPFKHKAQQKTSTKQSGMIPVSNSGNSLLGEIRSFDVMDIERSEFSSDRESVPAEILEYARSAMQNDERLRYGSPGQGLLRFHCANSACSVIRAEVTQGSDGPVVWQTDARFEPSILVNVHFMPDGKRFARRIINQLALDYQKSLKPLPTKINIPEE